MRTLKYRAYIKPLKRYAEKYETILYHHQCNMEPSWTVNISPEEYYGDEDLVIEQFTGLLDRNGEEIYEGDIVFFFTEHFDKATGGFDGEDEHNAIVEWFDNGFAFMDKVPYDPNIECEVIGNIHENPELLGGDE